MSNIIRPDFGRRSRAHQLLVPKQFFPEPPTDFPTLDADIMFYRSHGGIFLNACRRADEMVNYLFDLRHEGDHDASSDARRQLFARVPLFVLCNEMLNSKRPQWKELPPYYDALYAAMRSRDKAIVEKITRLFTIDDKAWPE